MNRIVFRKLFRRKLNNNIIWQKMRRKKHKRKLVEKSARIEYLFLWFLLF